EGAETGCHKGETWERRIFTAPLPALWPFATSAITSARSRKKPFDQIRPTFFYFFHSSGTSWETNVSSRETGKRVKPFLSPIKLASSHLFFLSRSAIDPKLQTRNAIPEHGAQTKRPRNSRIVSDHPEKTSTHDPRPPDASELLCQAVEVFLDPDVAAR